MVKLFIQSLYALYQIVLSRFFIIDAKPSEYFVF